MTSRDGQSQREEKRRREKIREEKEVRRKKMQVCEKVGKSRNTVFPMICGSGESKSRLAKAAGCGASWKDEKLHAVVARSTFPSQNVQKHTILGSLLEVEMSKKCTPLWREAHFEVKMYKAHHVRTHFWIASRGRAQGIVHLVKSEQNFCSISKTMAGVGHSKRICKDAFSVAGAVQETLELLGGEGADFLRGVAFWSIRSAGLLR